MYIRGDRVRKLRKTYGYSQEELAYLVGIDQKAISDYETGKGNPTASSLKGLADVLKTSIDFLTDRTDDPTPPISEAPDHLERKEKMVIELWREGKRAEAAALILTDSN